MSLLRPVVTVGGLTLASRVLGFARDMLVAALLGAGPVADAFFIAFRLPNLFRRVFAEGAFNAAFVPLFLGRMTSAGQAAALAFAEDSLAVLASGLLVVVLLAEIAMPWLMLGLAPGFANEPGKFQLAIDLTRLTFPYLLFISLVSLMGGVLNSTGRFAVFAAAPILLNLSLIVALLGLRAWTPTGGHALAWGVAIAGALQFLWLVRACGRAEMALRLPRPRLTPSVRRLLRLMLPAALGNGVVQVNLVVDAILASLLGTGAVSYLYYADRLYQLPLGVVGIAIGTAILPMLARQLKTGETAAATNTQNRGIEAALLLTLPAAAALIGLNDPVIQVLFQRGAFGPAEAQATAAALAAYAAGLPAYVLIKVLTPGFYAREDTATPVKIGVLSVAINIALAIVLIRFLAHVGIALATALAAWINVGMLAIILGRRGFLVIDPQLRRRAPRIAIATAIMTVVILLAAAVLAPWFAGTTLVRVTALALVIVLGLASFGGLVHLIGAADLRDLKRLLPRGRGRAADGGD